MTEHDPDPDGPVSGDHAPDEPPVPDPEPVPAADPAPDPESAQDPEPAPEPDPEVSDAEPAAEAPPVRQSRRWLWVGLVALAVLVGGAVAGATGVAVVQLLREDAPEVGDCLTREAVNDDIDIVDCGEGAAHWRVIGHDGAWTQGEFAQASDDEVCADHPDTQQALWVTAARDVSDDSDGEVVCLAPLARQG